MLREWPHERFVYVERDGRPLHVDLYRPELQPSMSSRGTETGLPPVILHLHGGAWEMGAPGEFEPNLSLLKAGFAVVDVEYRLSGVAPWPAQERDVCEALNWVRRNAAEMGVDRRKIGVWGLSAGGHLALMLGVQRLVDAVVAFAPPTDLRDPSIWAENVRPSLLRLFGIHEELAPSELAPNVHAYIPEFASPITHNLRGTAPTLLVHGDADDIVPVDQSVRMYERLLQSRVAASLFRIAEAGHDPGDSYLGWDGLAEIAIRFFRREFARSDET